jgi:hypothetical protein
MGNMRVGCQSSPEVFKGRKREMFRIYAVQKVAGEKVEGYLSSCCSELIERKSHPYVGLFDKSVLADVIASLDYDGCLLIEARIERI